jgi:O-antigen/teichoic acid export membrane protein
LSERGGRAQWARALRTKFVRDAGILHLAASVNQLGQLASAVALAFLLGARDQGLYVSATALYAFGHCLIHVGVPQATASQISANAARERDAKVASWVAFTAKVDLIFSLGLALVGLALFPLAAESLLGDRRIGLWASWLCLGGLFDVPRDAARVALQGTRRMAALGRVENAQELVRFFLIVLGALIAGGPAGAVLGSLLASAVGSLLAVVIYREARLDGGAPLPGVRAVLGALRDLPLRRGLRQGLRISLFRNAHVLLLSVLPRLLVQGLAGSQLVAYYHIAQRLMSLPEVLSGAVSRTALPALAEHAGRRDLAAFRRLFLGATLWSGGLISAGIWIGLLFVPAFVGLCFPADYVQPVSHFALILALGASIAAFGVCSEAFFITANQVRALYMLSLVGALLTIPANVWLVTHFAATGAAWAVVVYQSWTLSQLAYCVAFLRPRAGVAGPWDA